MDECCEEEEEEDGEEGDTGERVSNTDSESLEESLCSFSSVYRCTHLLRVILYFLLREEESLSGDVEGGLRRFLDSIDA